MPFPNNVLQTIQSPADRFRVGTGRYRHGKSHQTVPAYFDRDRPESELLANRAKSRRARLNVGGEHHEVLWETLKRLPNTRLGKLSLSTSPLEMRSLCDDYAPEFDEYYFDRTARSFDSILALYRTGQLHILDDVCVMALKDDLCYWGISEMVLNACCIQRYHQRKERMLEEIKKTEQVTKQFEEEEEEFKTGKWANIQRRVWDFVEKPQTSMGARIFAGISITFIVLSILGLNLSTLPAFRFNATLTNQTSAVDQDEANLFVDPYLEALELVCTIWFTVEYLVRFFSCPNKCVFIKSFLNIIDIIAILPFYFSKLFEIWLSSAKQSLIAVRKVVQMFRILRILRVFKLARHSQGLQALGYTLAKSYKELGLLMLFVILVVLLFSSLAYFAEKDDNPAMFSSIPATFWWAIITMTTVGYGDMTPNTVLGKVIGSVCCICGVLVVGLPIPIIVNNFAAFYQDQARREKVVRRRAEDEQHQQTLHRFFSLPSVAVGKDFDSDMGKQRAESLGTLGMINDTETLNEVPNEMRSPDYSTRE